MPISLEISTIGWDNFPPRTLTNNNVCGYRGLLEIHTIIVLSNGWILP